MIRGSIPFPVYVVIMAFLYWRISSGFGLKKRGKIMIAAVLAGALVLFIIHAQISLTWTIPPLFLLSGFLMGTTLITFSVFIPELFLSSILKKFRKIFVSAGLIISLTLSVFAFVQGRAVPTIKTIDLVFKDLPKELSGFTIAQLSDIHIERGITTEQWLRKIVDKTNSLKSDIIVITGDLVSLIISEKEKYSMILSDLKAPSGVYGVTGNHDFGNNLNTFNKILADTRIRVLANENIELSNGIILAGIDDKLGFKSRVRNRGPDLKKALIGISRDQFVILLSHRPGIFDKAADQGVDLQLSGHTHAGQIPPISIITKLFYKYSKGLYKYKNSYLYTSSGTGTWPFIPMRLFSKNEITQIVLTGSI